MKALKVILIFILVVILLAVIFIGYTIYQGVQVYNEVKNSGLIDNIESLSEGDCSKLEEVKNDVAGIRQKIKSACRNPLLKRIAEKKIPQYDICENINDEEIEEFLKEKRESCEAS